MKTIDISAFKAEVQSLTASETPYIYQVTGLKSDMFCQLPLADIPQETREQATNNPLREALSAAPGGVLIDLSPTELPPLDNGNFLFYGCANMVASPRLPEGIKELAFSYCDCIALETPPVLPEGVTKLIFAFGFISSIGKEIHAAPNKLTTPPVIPRSVGETDVCYDPHQDHTFPYHLQHLPNLSMAFVGSSITTPPSIPPGVKSLFMTFAGCSFLESFPVLPDTLTSMPAAFMNCASARGEVELPPSLADGVQMPPADAKNYRFDPSRLMLGGAGPLDQTFHYCLALEHLPAIPEGVTSATQTFFYCVKATSAGRIPNSLQGLNITYYHCGTYPDYDPETGPGDLVYNNLSFPEGQVFPFMCGNHWPMDSDARNIIALCQVVSAERPIPIRLSNLNPGDFDQRTMAEGANSDNPNPIRSTLANINNISPELLIDLSPTDLPPLDNGNFLFYGCANMVASPRLPEGIKELVAAFANCMAMEEPPHLPDGVTNLSMAFSGMVGSKDLIPMRLSRPPIIPRSVGETDQYNPSGTIGADYIPNMYHTFSGCFSMSEAPVIPEGIKSLDNTFSYCGLSSPPEIPASVVNMSSTFFMCTNLTTAPRIPPYMENMDMAFYGCNLSEAPELPATLKTMRGAFVNNTGMTRVLNVPPTVIDLSAAFAYCTNLEVIEEFAVNVTRCNMTDAFTQCQNLRAVYTPNHSIGRIGRWRMWQLTFDSKGAMPIHIEAKVFSENGAIEHHTFFEFTDADVEQGKLDIMFYHSGALGEIVQTKESDHLAEMVSQLLRYKIPVGNLPSTTKRVLHIDADILSGSAFVPPGVIMPYCASSAPEGWLICDGSAVSRDEYRILFNTIGGRYGTGDGSTTFNIPDTRSTLGQLSSIALSYIIKT